MIACVVFDFDGTLVDSNQVKVQAFYQIVEEYDPTGATVTEVLQRCFHKDRYGITCELARQLIAKGRVPKAPHVEELSAQWAKAYTNACQKAIETCREIPGTSVMLKWLSSQQIPLFINSRTPTDALRHLVALRNLTPYFSGIYGTPASKPENLRHIRELTTAASDEMLVVGDSEDDREAAAELGCHFVGVIVGENRRFKQIPALHVTNLTTLTGIIQDLQENRNVLVQNH